MQLFLHHINLQLVTKFSVSRESYSRQECIIVELRDGNISGFGEASAFMTQVYQSSIAATQTILLKLKSKIESSTFCHPEEMWEQFYEELCDYPFAQCALDVAAYDLWSRKRGISLMSFLGIDAKKIPESSYSLGIDTLANTVERIRAYNSWPEFKIKIGYEKDIEFLQALRQYTHLPFRVDVNCGWSLSEAHKKAPLLSSLGVKYLEEPLPAKDWKAYKELKQLSDLPLIADESCVDISSISNCAEYFAGVNIKLMKAGGITPALRMINKARSYNLKVFLGCMPESSVGASAIAQLAPLVDEIDLDCLAYITNDCADGIKIENGKIQYNGRAGTGVNLK
jgi:L-alanine-DL-glutamate epimerase-like enolase superfamily enzyme